MYWSMNIRSKPSSSSPLELAGSSRNFLVPSVRVVMISIAVSPLEASLQFQVGLIFFSVREKSLRTIMSSSTNKTERFFGSSVRGSCLSPSPLPASSSSVSVLIVSLEVSWKESSPSLGCNAVGSGTIFVDRCFSSSIASRLARDMSILVAKESCRRSVALSLRETVDCVNNEDADLGCMAYSVCFATAGEQIRDLSDVCFSGKEEMVFMAACRRRSLARSCLDLES
mmetsp:Transcript_21173/g.44517  ORF Transcript_21173/g.44517 Transcript_21173/m.44517 type:complete len:227 (+) Transcript_21173:824-1504(+)